MKVEEVGDINIDSVVVVPGLCLDIKIGDYELNYPFFWPTIYKNSNLGINFSQNTQSDQIAILVEIFLNVSSYEDYLPDNAFARARKDIENLFINNKSEVVENEMKSYVLRFVDALREIYAVKMQAIIKNAKEHAEQLEASRNEYIRQLEKQAALEAIDNPKITTGDLVEFTTSDWWKVRDKALTVLVTRVNFDQNILTQLSQSTKTDVRRAVAINPKTPTNILINLASDEQVEIRSCVAKNTSINEKILLLLLQDTQSEVALNLAVREDLPFVYLEFLSNQSQNTKVLVTLLANPNCPNPNEIVKKCLKIGLDKKSKKILCTNQNLDQFIVTQLTALIVDFSDTYYVTHDLAVNQSTPTELLELIVSHSDVGVGILSVVLKNPNCKPSVIEKMLQNITSQIESGSNRLEYYLILVDLISQSDVVTDQHLTLVLESLKTI